MAVIPKAETLFEVIKSAEDYQTAISEGRSIVYYAADWCGPCNLAVGCWTDTPQMKDFAEKHGIKLFYVDIDDRNLLGLVGERKLMSVPHFEFYESGKIKGDFMGIIPNDGMIEKILGAYGLGK